MSTKLDIQNEDGLKLPLVTFALLSYNQQSYIREAVQGALSQTYSPLQIILSDDFSTDSTFEIMQAIVGDYSGPHVIIINRNAKNCGISAHVNCVMKLAKGELIVFAAGDDVSLPDRVAISVEILNKNPSASFVSFSDIIIDSNSKEINIKNGSVNEEESVRVTLMDYLNGKIAHMSGASRCFRRKLFDAFNELNDSCPAEDGPYLLRGFMLGDGINSRKSVIKYRQHENNMSAPRSIHAMNFNEIRKQGHKDLSVAISKGIVETGMAKKIERWIEKYYQRRTFFSGLYYSKSRLRYFLTKGVFNKNLKLREKITFARMLLDPRRPFVCDFP